MVKVFGRPTSVPPDFLAENLPPPRLEWQVFHKVPMAVPAALWGHVHLGSLRVRLWGV